jgi:hypothetical protein
MAMAEAHHPRQSGISKCFRIRHKLLGNQGAKQTTHYLFSVAAATMLQQLRRLRA